MNLPGDLGLVEEVNLVLDEDHGHVSALVLHLLLPLPDGLERRPVRRREGHHARLRPPIVRLGDGVKLLLSGGVLK